MAPTAPRTIKSEVISKVNNLQRAKIYMCSKFELPMCSRAVYFLRGYIRGYKPPILKF